MPETDEPLTALLSSRAAFGLSSEALDLVRITDKHLRHGNVSWLEVGAGDGRNLQFQLEKLSSNRSIVVTALEPAEVSPAISGVVEWITSRSEDYRSDRRFDWISVRHAGYYFLDPIAEIQRLAGMLSDGGVLALTHWSTQCVLHRLHLQLCGELGAPGCAGVEEIATQIASATRVKLLDFSLHDSELDLSRVSADRNLAQALYVLACRGHPALAANASNPSGSTARLLKRLPNAKVRRNGILLLGASAR